jgi:hypothetical protein
MIGFSEHSGLFRFVSKQFCLFRLFRYRFETPKQTEKIFFWFYETNRIKRETDLVSVCFGSNRNFFFHFEDTLLLTMHTFTFNKTKRNSKYSKVRTVRIKCKVNNFLGAPFIFASSKMKRNGS